MLAPPGQMDMTRRRQLAEVAGCKRQVPVPLGIAEIAEERPRRDLDFVLIDLHPHVRQRPSGIVTVVTGAIEADDRTTFGQTIALVSRDAE